MPNRVWDYLLETLTHDEKESRSGSYDLYFGPEAPKGQEENWVPTGGEDCFYCSDLPTNLETFFKNWMLEDMEKNQRLPAIETRPSLEINNLVRPTNIENIGAA
ncbi:DUF1214 domain-containing protein [Vibrio chagasii]|nr:DUF1214 domain-containing protein [Vibrio chagasii]